MRLQAVSETRSSSASGRRDIRPERIAVTTRDRARYSGILKSGGRTRAGGASPDTGVRDARARGEPANAVRTDVKTLVQVKRT